MTTTLRTSNIVILMAAVAGAILLAGCASMGSANTTSLLTAAGFRARTPQTPKQQQIYAALPPYQVERATVPGKGVFYVYKDEKAGLAYIGREAEYQRYQQLAIQQQIAQDQIMAAEMERAAAWQWYGAWGPRAFWR
jgi:outer membrane murein-binding lipoprotein Lpp